MWLLKKTAFTHKAFEQSSVGRHQVVSVPPVSREMTRKHWRWTMLAHLWGSAGFARHKKSLVSYLWTRTLTLLSTLIIWKWLKKSDFLPKALPKFSVGQNLILNIIKLLEMSTFFFLQTFDNEIIFCLCYPSTILFYFMTHAFSCHFNKESHRVEPPCILFSVRYWIYGAIWLKDMRVHTLEPQVFVYLHPPGRNIWAV